MSNDNSLHLGGDGDDEDILRSIEECFAFEFAEGELAHITTIGSLHDAVLRHLPGTEQRRREHCRSATAFRKLRRALNSMSRDDVRPSTRLRDIIGDKTPYAFMTSIERESGLALEALPISSATIWACIAISAAASIGYFVARADSVPAIIDGLFQAGFSTIFGAIALFFAASALMRDRIHKIDRELITVGDLASRAVHLNFARLTGTTAQNHPTDVWRTLEWLVRQETNYRRAIDRETRLFG